MNTRHFFKNALSLLLKEPKLFIPKFLIAALFGIGMLLTAKLATEALHAQSMPAEKLYPLFLFSLLILLYTIIVTVLDTFVNAMYPVMVQQYMEKQAISFRNAMRFAAKKAKTVIIADFAALVVFIVLTAPLLYLIISLKNSGNAMWLAAGIFLLAVVFLFSAGFYWLYPVATLEKTNATNALKRTLFLSMENLGKISMASIVPFTVSVANMLLAFFYQNTGALILFLLLRILTAIVYTYHLVLNPTMYFGVVKKTAGK